LTLFFEGKVFSGKGEGKKYVALPWVKRQIKQKLGYNPYLGTLNICLSTKSIPQKSILDTVSGAEINPAKGYCPGKLIKAQISTVPCAIVVPQIPSYPKDVLEIVAPVNLREKLKLKDGDCVLVSVTV
jgi:riboflavin kinase, archaea type